MFNRYLKYRAIKAYASFTLKLTLETSLFKISTRILFHLWFLARLFRLSESLQMLSIHVNFYEYQTKEIGFLYKNSAFAQTMSILLGKILYVYH